MRWPCAHAVGRTACTPSGREQCTSAQRDAHLFHVCAGNMRGTPSCQTTRPSTRAAIASVYTLCSCSPKTSQLSGLDVAAPAFACSASAPVQERVPRGSLECLLQGQAPGAPEAPGLCRTPRPQNAPTLPSGSRLHRPNASSCDWRSQGLWQRPNAGGAPAFKTAACTCLPCMPGPPNRGSRPGWTFRKRLGNAATTAGGRSCTQHLLKTRAVSAGELIRTFSGLP